MEFITLNTIKKHQLIKDLVFFPLKIHHDGASSLIETLRIDWAKVYGKKRQFFMQYCSTIPSGTAKDENDWHYHNKQDDRITIINGSIVFVVADNREKSPTKGSINMLYMTSENPYLLIIPKKLLHGFLVVSKEKAIILNFPTALYNPQDTITIPFSKTHFFLSKDIPFSWKVVKENFDQYITSQ